jgi:hypothetical protein
MTPFERRAVTRDGVTYAPGRQFRVAREGAWLDGMVPEMGGHCGWRKQLQIGDLLTCTGYGPGFGADPGYGVEFTSAEARAAGASHCEVWPMIGGLFDYGPPPGLLEPADAGE